ncbi:MAG: Rid family detoxifying hydrolase [Pseudomonadota bacterium]|nr:Rid family detoxifying hydrolase [Pseudomonadota bacterium]HJO36176.1 Rid family detoxifying hydrolase [Gammaproteobacteria bacterium]
MPREPVHTDNAPAAIGTYSQAVRHGGLLFISGQIPLDPVTGALVGGDITVQVRQVFANLAAVADAAGTSLAETLKFTVYLTDLGDFATVNAVMEELLGAPYPARAAVEVAALPKGARVEVDAIVAC